MDILIHKLFFVKFQKHKRLIQKNSVENYQRSLHHYLIKRGLETLGINTFAYLFTSAANGLCLTASFFLAVFLMATAQFHFTENTLSLHFLFQDFQRLVNIISDNRNLYHLNHPFPYSLKFICELFNTRFFYLQVKNYKFYAIIFGFIADSTRSIFLAKPLFTVLRRFA